MLQRSLIIFAIILFSLFTVQATYAQFEIKDTIQTGYITTYAEDNNLVVLDFDVKKNDGKSDTLNAIVLQNIKNLPSNTIARVSLWKDSGREGFQGFSIDDKIGDFVQYQTEWILQNINSAVSATGERFFVTIDIDESISSEVEFEPMLTSLSDTNKDGVYNLGNDYGIFFNSNNDALITLRTKKFVTIKTDNRDILAPRIEAGNLDKDIIYTKDNAFTLTGFVQDRMDRGVQEVKVSVKKKGESKLYQDATFTKNENGILEWEYKALNIEYNTPYEIILFARDTIGNFVEKSPLEITFKEKQVIVIEVPDEPVVESNISFEKSRLFVNRDLAIRAPFEDTDIHAKVLLLDEAGKPIRGKLVTVHADRPGKQHQLTLMTGEDGTALWIINSTVNSTFTFYAEVDGKQLTQKPTIKFIDARLGGELIKASNSKAVYLLKDNKRYVFPNQAIYKSYYENFDSVKEITPEQMASYQLGGNIRYRPGSLIKIPSIPKVYRVNEEGVLNWIESESKAREMYGPTWASLVHDLADSYFVDYSIGNSVE